jgi:hypothetical protein
MVRIRDKYGQEEMVGFALIIIIVGIILLVFLGFSLREEQKENVESYEVESFIKALLQYTTDCENNVEHLTIQELIFSCDEKKKCLDGNNTCLVLESNLNKILNESWRVEKGSMIKGYELEILKEDSEILSIVKGNQTRDYKSAMQIFSKSGNSYHVLFTSYYEKIKSD